MGDESVSTHHPSLITHHSSYGHRQVAGWAQGREWLGDDRSPGDELGSEALRERCEGELSFGHRKTRSDALTWSAAERDIGKRWAILRPFRSEALGVESLGVFPHRRIVVDGVG